jgi:hypothetical protein
MDFLKVACTVKHLTDTEIKKIFLKHTNAEKFDDEYGDDYDYHGIINGSFYGLHLMKLNKGLLVDMDLEEDDHIKGILNEFKNYSNLRMFPLTIN